jgi:hypothetical protein
MRKLVQSIKIQASADAVWDALKDFGDVAAWAPYMRISHLVGELESGKGVRRAMQHELGFRFEEKVTEWREGHGYDFDVFKAPWPMKDVRESWQLQQSGDEINVSTRVEYGMKLGPLGALADFMLVRFIVLREMRSGVRGLKEYVERSANSK